MVRELSYQGQIGKAVTARPAYIVLRWPSQDSVEFEVAAAFETLRDASEHRDEVAADGRDAEVFCVPMFAGPCGAEAAEAMREAVQTVCREEFRALLDERIGQFKGEKALSLKTPPVSDDRRR